MIVTLYADFMTGMMVAVSGDRIATKFFDSPEDPWFSHTSFGKFSEKTSTVGSLQTVVEAGHMNRPKMIWKHDYFETIAVEN